MQADRKLPWCQLNIYHLALRKYDLRPVDHESSLSGQPCGVQYPQKCLSDQAHKDGALDIDDLKKTLRPMFPRTVTSTKNHPTKLWIVLW